MEAPTGYTSLVALYLQDASGTPLAAGSINVQPTDANDCPIEATAGGAGGLLSIQPVAFPIAGGALGPANLTAAQTWQGAYSAATAYAIGAVVVAAGLFYVCIQAGTNQAPATAGTYWTALSTGPWLPDTSLTKPANISYRFTVRDQFGEILGVVKGVQPTGATFNLDTFQPANSTGQVITQLGFGTITTLAAGAAATASIASVNGVPTLSLGIPAGAPGAVGPAGPAGSVAALTDGVTAVSQSIVVNYGVLAVIPTALLAAGIPFALVFADTVTGQNIAMRIVNGARGSINIGTLNAAAAVAGLTLIDTLTGNHWTISYANGAEVYTPVASSVAGALEALLADSATGAHFALTFNGGEFGFAPHS